MDFKWMLKMAAGAAAVCEILTAAEVLNEPYGIVSHVDRPSHDFPLAEREFALLKSIGVNWVRVDHAWGGVSRKPGEWDFSTIDSLHEKTKQGGIRLLPILDYDVKWARPAWKNLDLWREYVRLMVSRYAKDGRHWEVWNEENLPGFWHDTQSGENYVKLLQASYEEIKKVDPGLQMVYGGTSGVPLGFIEDTLRAGAGKWYDVMNVHPYHMQGAPEDMIPDLRDLQTLLRKYQVDRKPLWITELGWSTAPRPAIFPKAFAAALKRAGIEAEQITAAVIDDPGNGYTNVPAGYDVDRDFPIFREIARIKLAQLKRLDVKRFPVLLILGESFPAKQIADAADYVKRGGTLLCANGFPFYYELNPGKNANLGSTLDIPDPNDNHANMVSTQVTAKYAKMFHFGWETWWTDGKIPRSIKGVKPAPDFQNDFGEEPRLFSSLFLHERNLAPGDEFIPIIQADNGKYRGTVAALYKLNSDLKGNVILCTSAVSTRSVSEEQQAQFLPRSYLIGFAHGVERIFWYCLRSEEWEPMELEHNFGILHRDLAPKPAFAAFQTLTRLCPTGSTIPKLSANGTLYKAEWSRPDGVKVWAVWSRNETRNVDLKITGRTVEVLNHLGEKLPAPEGPIAVGPSVTYLVGAENISW